MEKGEEWGLPLISESLLWAIEASPESNVLLLLETTAGQGTNLGFKIYRDFWRFREVRNRLKIIW
jgi:hypothetical protein